MKKVFNNLFMFVVVVIVFTICFAFSAGALDATGQCGDSVYWSYDENTQELIISGEGEMWHFDLVEDVLIFDNDDIKTLVIEDGVTSIGAYSFCYCKGLESVIIPDSVETIYGYAFAGCEKLAEIEISDEVKQINNNAFYLTKYYEEKSNWEEGILYIGNHIIEVEKDIKSCKIKNGTKTIASYAFSNCSDLFFIEIPEGITVINEAAFYDCNLSTIVLYDSVTSIGNYAFAHCNLSDVYYSGTEEQWKEIDVEYFNFINEELYNATIHYNYNPKHQHSYCETILEEATCVNEGLARYDCIFCWITYTEKIELSKEHIYTSYNSDNNATCTTDGTKTAVCKNGCGAKDTVIDTGSATGHIDSQGDNKCDICGEEIEKLNFLQNLILRIKLFFMKLFGLI